MEIPPEADLSQASFLYATQSKLARRALVVPFAALERLAAGVALPERLVFVFNIARCGSTLVNAMLNRVDGSGACRSPTPSSTW